MQPRVATILLSNSRYIHVPPPLVQTCPSCYQSFSIYHCVSTTSETSSQNPLPYPSYHKKSGTRKALRVLFLLHLSFASFWQLVTVKFGSSLFSLSFWILSKLISFSLMGFVGHSHTATSEIEGHPFPVTQMYCGQNGLHPHSPLVSLFQQNVFYLFFDNFIRINHES